MKNITVVLLQQATSYIRYTQRMPMFFGFLIMIVCILAGFQFNASVAWIEWVLDYFFDQRVGYTFDLSDVAWLFLQVSLGLYILGTVVKLLFQYIYKKQLEFNFKLKMKIVFYVALGGYVLAGILWKISPINSIMINKADISPVVSGLLLAGGFIFTLIASFYTFIIDAVMDVADRSIVNAIVGPEKNNFIS